MKKLLIVCGGQSSEHLVSRMSCTSVLKNIHKEKYDITVVGINKEGEWFLLDKTHEDLTTEHWLDHAKPIHDVYGLIKQQDVIFPVLHGRFGEDGTIQGLFELARVPYVGCKVLGSTVSMDKIYTKKILETVGIPQVKSMYVKKRYDGTLVAVDNEFNEYTDIVERVESSLGFPCFVKASNAGSSIGCYKVETKEEFYPKLQEAALYDRKVVVEECIDCIELECAVLGNDDVIISRVGQIMPHGDFYTFESKYEDEESQTRIPALVDQSIQDEVQDYSKRVFKAVDGHGLSRVDFFFDKRTGKVYLNEINTMPGFTKISMYPELIEDFGISYTDLIDQLIELAFDQ